jgi:hypothetical protein
MTQVPHLYISAKGVPWRKHSYSSGNIFDQCPLKYYLQKVLGWRERDNKASFKFGRALEESVQFYHDTEGSPVEDFIRRWSVHEEEKLHYTKTEKDWSWLGRMGKEMMELYVIKQPNLPIPMGGHSVWQREYAKNVFPGDPNYGEIEDAGKLDIIAYNDPNHPMLAKLDWKPEYGILRPVIVDIKTTAIDYPENPGIAAFDKQLRRYSWLSGIRDVAFLVFKKTGHNLSKGSSVTFIRDAGADGAHSGDEAVIAQTTDDGVWVVRNDFLITEMEKAQGRNAKGKLDTTKAAEARKDAWLQQHALLVQPSYLTRQRIQFSTGFVSKESADEAGLIAGGQIVRIVNASKNKQWPNTFGIRFPNDDSRDPYFRAFVLGDKAFQQENFIKTAEENFDDLFAEESDTDE